MAASQLPDFEQALALARGQVDEGDLSECHGVACGLACRRPGDGAARWFGVLAMLELLTDPDPGLQRALEDLHAASLRQLDDEQMRFALWLPADEEPLEDRTEALAHWCTGFLAGLGSAGELEGLSDDAAEAIDDLGQIAQAEVSGTEENEEEEAAYAEIVEYIRVAVLMLKEDLRRPRPDEPIHQNRNSGQKNG